MAVTAEVGFAPLERPRVSVANDGTLAAIHEPTRISIVELPGGAPFAEVGVDPDAGATEVAWVGAPPRLLVLSRFAAHTTVHLLDPYGPRTVAEIRLESPMKLFATAGSHALAVGAGGAAILTAGESHLAPYQFPARAMPVAAGAAASQMVVALSGSIEEWDPQSRMPKRRLKLPRPAQITAVGGSDRVVWMTTAGDPTRIDVIPLVNRGQPKFHDLPEPIGSVASHPRSDLIACLGADSGRMYVIDLDGRTRMRTIAADGIDRIESAGLVVGRLTGVLVAQARRPLAIASLDGRDIEAALAEGQEAEPETEDEDEPAKPSSLYGEDGPRRSDTEDEESDVRSTSSTKTAVNLPSVRLASEPGIPKVEPPPAPVTDVASVLSTAAAAIAAVVAPAPEVLEPPPPLAKTGPLPVQPAPAPSLFRQPAVPVAPPRAPQKVVAPPSTQSGKSLSERFSAWRERTRASQPRAVDPNLLSLPADPRPSWRDDVVAWARSTAANTAEKTAPPSAPPVEALADRFELPPYVVPALVLLYGAHLGGEPGAAPVDVARILGRRWDEALGRGLLAAHGLATYEGSRVRLAPVIVRALDGLMPTSGPLVGEPGMLSLLGPCVVVSADPIAAVAERIAATIGGAVLVGTGGDAHLVEARAIGAAPMFAASASTAVPAHPAVLVVDDDAAADALGLPRL